MLTLSEAEAGRQIDLAVGEEAELLLPEKRLAGYHWEIEESGKPVVAVEDRGAAPPDSPLGGANTRRLRIQAVEPGTATVRLRHRRSWEPPNSGRTVSFTFQVSS